VRRERLAQSPGLLGSQIQRLVLLATVQLPQVLLLLLVHHNVNASNGFADHADLGELGGGTARDLGHTQVSQLLLEVIELLGKLLLLFGAELGALDLHLEESTIHSKYCNLFKESLLLAFDE